VEAYCVMCDLFWQITRHELDDLAAKLAVNRRSARNRFGLARRFGRPLWNVVNFSSDGRSDKDS
jgi:hypothetical protein